MRLLVVAATQLEIAPLLGRLGVGLTGPSVGGRPALGKAGTLHQTPRCDVLISGVGQLQCATQLTRALLTTPYDLVLQAGIGGSFVPTLPRRSVVLVEEEALADLGAETRDGFADITDMGLMPRDESGFTAGVLRASRSWAPPGLDLPWVRSVTVNRVLDHEASIAWVRQRYAPDVVNMEGAALLYACLQHGVPCIELRAISDQVGPRDTTTWDIPGAITALDAALERCLGLLERGPGASP